MTAYRAEACRRVGQPGLRLGRRASTPKAQQVPEAREGRGKTTLGKMQALRLVELRQEVVSSLGTNQPDYKSVLVPEDLGGD